MKNQRKKYVWIVVVAVVVVVALWAVSAYNSLVEKDEQVSAKWASVETQYQRRADLIPNLVATVKGYATHESETLESVIAARSEATGVHVDASDLSEESLKEYEESQSKVGAALGRLLAVAESYPELKADESFLELQAQIEGTENRIAVARRDYNLAAREYNVAVRRFPRSIAASLFGFSPKAYYEASSEAATAPVVEF